MDPSSYAMEQETILSLGYGKFKGGPTQPSPFGYTPDTL